MTITNQVYDFPAVCSFLIPINFLACVCLAILPHYPCYSMTFLMTVLFLYLFCLFCICSRSRPLSIALPAFTMPSVARLPLYHSSSPFCHSHRTSIVVLSCKFAMPLAHTINSLQIDVITLLSRIPFTTMQSCRSHSDFQFVYNPLPLYP